ncbi:glycoside hydrolase family 128 protein [Scleroderma yunnanense]
MAGLKLLNLFALVSVALVVLSSAPGSVNALVADRSHVARHIRGHEAVAKKRRGTCNPQTTTSVLPTTIPTDTPTNTPTPSVPVSTPSPSTTTTSSSSTPAPSSASSTSGNKKWGLAWPNGDASYLSTFAALPNVGFLYSWSPYIPPETSSLGLKGVPMLWGFDQVSQFQQLVVAGYAEYVLGMNEPNEPSQSNMSPSDGVTLWQTYINPLKDQGYKLISPACTNDQAGLDWYQQFFAQCSGCHFDAVAFHAYTNDAQSIIDYATTLYNTYNLPIWITEFADQNFSGTGGQASMDEIWAFAGTMTNFINNTPWLEVAFPFGVMSDLQGVNTLNSLLDGNNNPTALAYTYFG